MIVTRLDTDGRASVYSMRVPDGVANHLPLRWQEVQRSFVRQFQKRGGCSAEFLRNEVRVERSEGDREIATRELARLERSLTKRLYRPLAASEAASLLGIGKREFKTLAAAAGIEAGHRVAAHRSGRSYSYAAYAAEDIL